MKARLKAGQRVQAAAPVGVGLYMARSLSVCVLLMAPAGVGHGKFANGSGTWHVV